MAIFKGGKGRDDTFTGGTKADRFEFDPLDLNSGDTIVGGLGRAVDVLRFTASGAIGVTALAHVSGIERIELASGGANSLIVTDALVASAYGERIQVAGGNGDDFVYATDLHDDRAIDFVSNGGTDYVFAGEGDDTFTFDLATIDGADRVDAGIGTNTLILTGSGSVGDAQLSGMTSINTVALGNGGTTLAIGNVLWGQYQLHSLTVNGGGGADVIDVTAMTDVYQLVLTGGDGDDTIVAGSSSLDSLIDGGVGADRITAGNAAVAYDPGDVSVAVGTGTLVLRAAATIDLTRDGDQSLDDTNVVTGFVGVDASTSKQAVTLTGGAGDTLIGGSASDTISGASTIAGGRGADTLTGATGTRFILGDGDFARGEVMRSPGNSVLQVFGTNDLRIGKVAGITAIAFGEFFQQGSHFLTAFSSQLADVTSIGGYGGHLTVVMDKAGVALPAFSSQFGVYPNTIDVLGSKGNDTIVGSFRDIHAGDGNDVIRGIGSVYGEGGDDAVSFTLTGALGVADGGSGSDTLTLIHDTYSVDLGGSLVVDLSSSRAQVSFQSFSATGFESVDLSAVSTYNPLSVTIRGSDAANVLVGSAMNDTISGGAGADVIDGGAGVDRLTGGAGADRFQFTRAGPHAYDNAAPDTIVDYTSGEDLLVFARTGSSDQPLFDFTGNRFDTLVDATSRSTNLKGADLVTYTAGKLSGIEDVAAWLSENGTAASGEGLFVAAAGANNHVTLYYLDAQHDGSLYYSIQTVADLGTIAPAEITLSDFAFI